MKIDKELIKALKSDIEHYGYDRCFNKIDDMPNALLRVLLREHMAIAQEEVYCTNLLRALTGGK